MTKNIKTLKICFLQILTSQFGDLVKSSMLSPNLTMKIFQKKFIKSLKICKLVLNTYNRIIDFYQSSRGYSGPLSPDQKSVVNPTFTRQNDGEVEDTPSQSLEHPTLDILNKRSHRAKQLWFWDR